MDAKTWILILTLVSVGLLINWAAPAVCWDCRPRKCWNDLECELGCWCYKGDYQLTGVCVSD